MKEKNRNRGFTLIELLAVVVILGVIMAIAIPLVSGYIDSSKKESYIKTAQAYARAAQSEVNSEKYQIDDPNAVYYIHISNIEMKEHTKSPYGEWKDAYVVVTLSEDRKLMTFYWVSVDQKGYKIKLKEASQLKKRDIIHENDQTISATQTIGGRDKIILIGEGNQEEEKDSSVEMTGDEAKTCFQYQEGPSGITIIDYQSSCPKAVDVPSKIDGKTVIAIGKNAFRGKQLTAVHIYYGITTVGYGAFMNNSITDLKLSASIKTISDYAFYNNKLPSLSLPEGLVTIGAYGFATNKIRSVAFSSTIKTIGAYAFHNNLLDELVLSNSANIAGGAFSGNQMDEDAAFIYARNTDGTANYSKIIGYAGTKRENVVIPASKNGVALKTIGANAFASCGLISITIPDTVTSIEGSAFYNNKLTSLRLPSGLKSIGSQALRSNQLRSIEIPASVTSIGSGVLISNQLPDDQAFIYRRTTSGIDYSTIVSYGGAKRSNVVIPATKNGVTLIKIDSTAFASTGLVSFTIPDTVREIADGAFNHNNVPKGSECEYVYKRKNGVTDYSYLSSYAGQERTNIVIPEQKNGVAVRTLAGSLYSWKSYKSITVPSTVTSIGTSAFYKNGSSNLNFTKIINKTGRKFDWKAITAGSDSATFVTGTVIHNAGDIEVVDH